MFSAHFNYTSPHNTHLFILKNKSQVRPAYFDHDFLSSVRLFKKLYQTESMTLFGTTYLGSAF